MAEIAQNFEIHAGDDLNLDFQVKDSAGLVVNITGATFEWALKKHPTVIANIVAKTSAGGGVTIVDAPTGKFRVALASADTIGVNPAVYYHEAEMTLGGAISTVAIGYGTVQPAGT